MSDRRDNHHNRHYDQHDRRGGDDGYHRDNRDHRGGRDNRDNQYYRDDRDQYARDNRQGKYNNINFNPKRKIDYDDNEKSMQITRQFDGPRKFVRGRGGGGRGAPRIISGSMVPKAETPMPQQVKLAMKVVTTLGNYSEMTEQDDLIANIRALSNIFLSVGDLTEYAEEISDLFLNCFSTLSIQAPINASLLSLIHIKDQTFTKLVTSKIQKKLLQSLQSDDVPTSKLLLKSIACLSNCKSFAIDSYADGSLLPLLNALLELARKCPSSSHLTEEAQVALYLVSSTVPWCVELIRSLDSGRDFLTRLQAVSQEVIRSYQCPYAVGGAQAIFHDVPIPTDEDSARPLSMAGSTRNPGTRGAYDSLYEAVFACHQIITTALTSTEGFVAPACMISPWQSLVEDLSPLEQGEVDPLHFDSRFILEVQSLFSQRCIGARARTCQMVGNNISPSVGAAAGSSFLQARVPVYDNETSNEAAACSSLSEVEKYIANHYFQDILHFFDPIVLEDGTKKGSVELLSVHLLAVFKLFPKETHIEYLLLEVLFGVLLQQPSNPIASSNIYKLILILCKKTASNSTAASSLTYYSTVFPPALALIVNILYQMIPDMLVGSIVDFSNWFAFHLVNTQLSWPYWEFWNDELRESLADGSGTSAQKLFASHFVLKLSKAVVLDKLLDVLPDAYAELLPPAQAHVPKCSLYPPAENVVAPAAESTEVVMADGDQPSAEVVTEGEGLTVTAPTDNEAVVKTDEEPAVEVVPDTPVVALRKHIQDKISPEDLVEWFENDVMAKDEAATTQWCSVLLLQAILSLGSINNTLAGITGLLDRYSMVLRSLAHTEVEQQALLDTLVDAYGLDSAMFMFCLDEMVRRSQIATTAVLNWASPKLLLLNQNTTLYTICDTIVERSVDFVRASVAQRAKHGGDLPLDASLDLTPAPEPEPAVAMATADSSNAAVMDDGNIGASSDSAAAAPSEELEEVDYSEDVEAPEGQREGKRQRREEQQQQDEEGIKTETTATAAEEEQHQVESTQDPLWLTTEAVKTAIGNIRTVYGGLLSTLSKGIATAQQQPHGPGNALWVVVAQSLILKTLRATHGAERNLSHTYQKPVLLSEVPGKVVLYLEGSGALKTIWNDHFKM